MNAGVTSSLCLKKLFKQHRKINHLLIVYPLESLFTAKQSAVTQELPLLHAAQATWCHARTEICNDFHACMSSQSPEKGFVGTLITGEAADDLRMGVKIVSEAYLVWSHTGATLFSAATF